TDALARRGVTAEVAVADDVKGGVRVRTPRRSAVENTLYDRLDAMAGELAAEVSQVLFGAKAEKLMSRDLGYINARVRGLKSKLLGPAFTQAALEGTDFRAFLTALSQSPYMREVEEAQARYGGLAVVDSAVARNFYHTARSLLSFSDGKPRELIGLLLLRYDLANVKAIARGKHAGKDADDIRGALFPAGELKPALLEEAAAAADVPSAAQVLAFGKNELGAAFLKAARRYQDDKDLYALEL